ncbi:thymidylate kinase-like isoform X2 [Mizuhopecten yessoensis]|uniref:thymidylate kinase-like isoform X2 n=1 Tax=Mizuhopecten yessoensis TaxID=6573 RepID=UPI000B45B029|nr:thymidylate kinase-like isoform X2 [Mizuhopecten yessoensis]XP_021377739.1 thymidylate kinase-like isoform X2 [Mizuhopecten yessoensis]XP_021377740.1 thymidylate kinase-like isoform X2 [Mizuhopecten yessoensis]XP_021377741.1 thymidylate kinase-like isoform X2 [Mizuhopecten yessoensis]
MPFWRKKTIPDPCQKQACDIQTCLQDIVNNQARLCAMKRGALIVFEGGDHSGKTTQCTKLIHAFESAGEKVKLFKFPDRTSTIGQMINNYLGSKCEIEDHSVHLLFSANRWEKQPRMMELLESGTTLIVDRYAFSGVAFTAAKPGFAIEWCKQPDIGLPRPDLVCFLTLDTEAAAKRGTFGGERYERTDFQKKVMNNFEKLKDSTWKEIDADKSIDDLHKEILDLATTTMASVAQNPIEKLWMPDDTETKCKM